MSAAPHGGIVDLSMVRRRALADFSQLGKPRVVFMVLITTLVGFHLASDRGTDLLLLGTTLLGTGLAAAGTMALNQYLEIDFDARMERTRDRPLPSGRLQPLDALTFGALLVAVGLVLLCVLVNVQSGFVTALTVIIYLGLYTPMKRRSSLCSLVGAIPGALPPVTGWVAACGRFDSGAWVLFGILFLWQLPHSLAIAKLYMDDYADAGFRLLPVVDRGGCSTERQILVNCAALVAFTLLPTLLGIAGSLYFVSAFLLSLLFLASAIWAATRPSRNSARRLLIASLLYLPVLLAFMAVDKV